MASFFFSLDFFPPLDVGCGLATFAQYPGLCIVALMLAMVFPPVLLASRVFFFAIEVVSVQFKSFPLNGRSPNPRCAKHPFWRLVVSLDRLLSFLATVLLIFFPVFVPHFVMPPKGSFFFFLPASRRECGSNRKESL